MKKTLLIVMPDRELDARRLAADLGAMIEDLEVRIWPDVGPEEDVRMVVSWKHPAGVLGQFPNLELVASFGAGIEHIFLDDALPAGVPIVRTVDESLVRDMVEYVLSAVMTWRRGWESFRQKQAAGIWAPEAYALRTSVLVLGVGRLGGAVAKAFLGLGHQVSCWSRTRADPKGVQCLKGKEALFGTLPRADAVICLLPLTQETEDILNRDFFAHMKENSLLVNVGRGRHLVDEDLLEALDHGRPGHAVLDVFRKEPLPADHPFWHHPQITLTPHVAALTDPMGAAKRVAENWCRLCEGKELLDVLDVERGY